MELFPPQWLRQDVICEDFKFFFFLAFHNRKPFFSVSFIYFGEFNLSGNTLNQFSVFLQVHMQISIKGHRFQLV